MSDRFIVDTNVISESSKARPDENVLRWVATVERITLSSVTVLELASGIEAVAQGKRRQALEGWLAGLMREAHVVPFDRDAALIAASLSGSLRRAGRSIGVHDLMIAATARAERLTIATRNVAHFKGLGVSVYDPFTGSYAI